jgi:hypothetical protein
MLKFGWITPFAALSKVEAKAAVEAMVERDKKAKAPTEARKMREAVRAQFLPIRPVWPV